MTRQQKRLPQDFFPEIFTSNLSQLLNISLMNKIGVNNIPIEHLG